MCKSITKGLARSTREKHPILAAIVAVVIVV